MRILLMFLITIVSFNMNAQQKKIGENSILKSEFIYEIDEVSFPSCHASTIAETSDGLVAAWFGGQYEKHPEVGIWVSRFLESKWSAPVEVANGIQHNDLQYPTWNPVLFNYGNELFLFFKEGPNPRDWWGEYMVSEDNGKTWSQSCRLPEEIYGPIKNKPVLLQNGDLLCPSSTEHDGWRVHMEMTPDRGKTWERTEALNSGENYQAIQPTILEHSDGKLQILCRSKNQYILSAWSDNNGRTWSDLKPIDLPNPNSGIDAVTMKDGRHVLVYNHIYLKDNWSQRNVINLAVSDDGIHWDAVVLLEDDADEEAEFSYPAMIQTDDGLLQITYTWNRKLIKHVVVDPEKFKPAPVEEVWGAEPQTNAEKLGFPAGQKVLLLHMDDLGMCEEANQAGRFYIENNFIRSGAVMMPCPNAEEFVEWAKDHPDADIGAHLTLTSEWKDYRWPPLTDKPEVPGLIDSEGKMWRSVPPVVMNATPGEVEMEIRAQIDKMIALGLRPSHIDTHMGTLYGSPDFVKVFLDVAQEYHIPANAIDLSNPKVAEFYRQAGYPINEAVIGLLEDYKLPKLDNFGSVPNGKTYEEKKDNFFKLVNSLEPGLTEIIFHPSVETENLKSITGSWQQRVWEAKMFADSEMLQFFDDNNIIITNWKEIMQRFE